MLKYLLAFLVVVLVCTVPANAINISVYSGIIDLDKVDSGLMTGISIGTDFTPVWEGLITFGYFQGDHQSTRNIARVTRPPESKIETDQVEVTTTYMPILANIQANIPLTDTFTPIMGAGLGWSFMNEDVTILDPEYQREGIVGYERYHGFATSAWGGFKFAFLANMNLTGRFAYTMNFFTAREDIEAEGFVQNEMDIDAITVQAGIEYRFR